ncbi:hypothetical protein [Kineococcus terrestris]|uniref:hypothetical protein n=1 Tax=Kineococcus terrestris TaxID=2044856 RepID=UPI0034DABB60
MVVDVVVEDVAGATRWRRAVARWAVVAAAGACVVVPLLALSWFRTPDGAPALVPPVTWWAEPADRLLEPLLGFGSPARVYATWLVAAAVLFPAVLVSVVSARRERRPATRVERGSWVVVVVGAGLSLAGVALVGGVLSADPTGSPVVDLAYLSLMLPGQLLVLTGSTVLGVSLLRSRWAPRAAAWWLAAALPLALVLSTVLGHNSFGMLPLFLAWGVRGAHVLRGTR